jgi:hypothetical protein
LVFILMRKPCFLARRRLLGWYVRFTRMASSRRPRAGSEQGSAREAEPPSVPARGPRSATRASRFRSSTAPCRAPCPVVRFRASRGCGRPSRTSPVEPRLHPAVVVGTRFPPLSTPVDAPVERGGRSS